MIFAITKNPNGLYRMNFMVKFKKYVDHIIMLTILLWGNISAICYLINGNNFVLQKTQQQASTIIEIIWNILLLLSSGLSHFLCYILGLEIRSWQINYTYAVFMSVQLVLYYFLACAVIYLRLNKKEKPCHSWKVIDD